jgi:hypothetical protein
MGLFKRPGKDDESIIEVSNDNGDHWVIHAPTNKVRGIEKDLRGAGCEPDHDDQLKQRYRADEIVKSRDHDQHRYHSARVVDEYEDFEDNHDRELEADDYERDEQPADPWWKLW